jgi:hypothetical protein
MRSIPGAFFVRSLKMPVRISLGVNSRMDALVLNLIVGSTSDSMLFGWNVFSKWCANVSALS